MVNFRVETEPLPLPAATLLVERDCAAFRALLAKTLKLGRMEFVESVADGDKTLVKLVTAPELGDWIPRTLRRYLEGPRGLEFTDHVTYDPALLAAPPYRLPTTTVPSFFSEKVDINVVTIVEELQAGKSCRQVLEGSIRVRMVGVGKLIEGVVVESIKRTYEALPQVVERWCRVRQELLQQPGGQAQLLAGVPACMHSAAQRGSQALGGPPLPLDLTCVDADVQRSLQAPFLPTPCSAQRKPQRKRPPPPLDLDALTQPPKAPARGAAAPSPGAARRNSLASAAAGGSDELACLDGLFSAHLDSAGARGFYSARADSLGSSGGGSSFSTRLQGGSGRGHHSPGGGSRGNGVPRVLCPRSNSGGGSRSGRRGVPRGPAGGGSCEPMLMDLRSSMSLSEAGSEYFDPTVELACNCGACGACELDAATARAVRDDRQTALATLGNSETCETLDMSPPASPLAPLRGSGDSSSSRSGSGLLAGWDMFHLFASREDSTHLAMTAPLAAGTLGDSAGGGGGHRRGGSWSSFTSRVASLWQPWRQCGGGRGQWTHFNAHFQQWEQVWDEMHVAQAPVPHPSARMLHLLALLQQWGLVRLVGNTAAPHDAAAPGCGAGWRRGVAARGGGAAAGGRRPAGGAALQGRRHGQ